MLFHFKNQNCTTSECAWILDVFDLVDALLTKNDT